MDLCLCTRIQPWWSMCEVRSDVPSGAYLDIQKLYFDKNPIFYF